MDQHLIATTAATTPRSRGGGGNGGSSGGRKLRSPSFRRRTDAIAYGSSYQKAAALVDLAEDGVGIPEKILDQSNFQTSAKFYFIFMRLNFLWVLNVFALLLLNFLEKPLWCATVTESCNNREYYYLGQLPYLTAAESLIYEGITLTVLLIHTFFPITYEGRSIFWKNPIVLLKVIFLLILFADSVAYALYVSPTGFTTLPFRIAPYVRVVIFILNIRELRDSIIILAGMLGTYLNVLALALLFLLFSTWLAYVIFEDTQQGMTVFSSYGTTLYHMFVLFTTSNNPDVWIPAYNLIYCFLGIPVGILFFVMYILVGVYFVTNLVLAVVYDSFKSELVKQVYEKDRLKNSMLAKAFNLIDVQNVEYLNKEQCIRLFEELNKYRTLPGISREEYELIFDELDDSHDFKIDLDEFADLCNAISLRFHKEDIPSWLESYPQFYHSHSCEMVKSFVRGPKFGYVIAFILLLNLVAVIIETTLDIADSSAQQVWQVLEFVFGWIYVLEMALKVFAFGFDNYWRDGQNRFDFFITWIIVIGETTTFVAPNNVTFLSNGEWIRYLLLARMLRLIRLLMHVQRYRAFVATFLNLIPSLMPYLGTIFCILCIYCSLGLQIFGGIVNAENKSLEETDLYDNDYLLFNFNDYPNGMVTLFNLLIMGNWQAWMQSYRVLTGTVWSLAYFISFYLITVLLLLNLVVAFVLEAFFAELDLEESEKGDDQTRDGRGNDRPRRRSTGSKSRSQRIDALLHHMLSAELCQPQSAET